MTAYLTLVIGGTRSGKSQAAEQRICAHTPPWIYVATAEAGDAEMAERIALHRTRRDDGWLTHEEAFDLVEALDEAPRGAPVLVDSLTIWLSNIMLAEHDVVGECDRLIARLEANDRPLVIVSDEVGLGIVPDNRLARSFRDHAGLLNQRVAEVADEVVMMIAGLPMKLK
jgi:adenosylcobinamide kinase/adenosylcobinamide-phosphate guanylyltransferase